MKSIITEAVELPPFAYGFATQVEAIAMSTKHKIVSFGMMRWLLVSILSASVINVSVVPVAEAVPKQIIILRHGEKQDGYKLCVIGQQRSLALQKFYLGKDAANSLFPSGTGPDGFFAITLHTLELASPAAQSWGMPMQLYSVVPLPDLNKQEEMQQLNKRTQEAAHEVLTNPRWDGKTVVMVWEHHHIADKKLESQYTLRQLLNLDKLPDVPESWKGDNYDYFWIVDYGTPGSAIPTKMTPMKQVFPAPYEAVPSNDWGVPELLPKNSGCKS